MSDPADHAVVGGCARRRVPEPRHAPGTDLIDWPSATARGPGEGVRDSFFKVQGLLATSDRFSTSSLVTSHDDRRHERRD